MDKEKVEDENDNVECTVPAGVLYSMCCHFVPEREFDSVSNNDSKSKPSQEDNVQMHITMIKIRIVFFIILACFCPADPNRNPYKESVGRLVSYLSGLWTAV